MFDVHCHLEYMPEDVIKEAKEKKCFFISSVADPKDMDEILKLKEKHDFSLSLGFHPERITKYNQKDIDEYIEKIKQNKEKIVAIGEVGLDYSWIKEHEKQNLSKKIFEKFISLANELEKPLVIHCRSENNDKKKIAMNDCLALLRKARVKVIMHFFSGTKEHLEEALNRQYYISFTTLTCKSKTYKKIAKITPMKNMVLETDAPWLDPNNNSNNELTNRPWNIEKTAEVIAKLKNITKEEVLSITEKNAKIAFEVQ